MLRVLVYTIICASTVCIESRVHPRSVRALNDTSISKQSARKKNKAKIVQHKEVRLQYTIPGIILILALIPPITPFFFILIGINNYIRISNLHQIEQVNNTRDAIKMEFNRPMNIFLLTLLSICSFGFFLPIYFIARMYYMLDDIHKSQKARYERSVAFDRHQG